MFQQAFLGCRAVQLQALIDALVERKQTFILSEFGMVTRQLGQTGVVYGAQLFRIRNHLQMAYRRPDTVQPVLHFFENCDRIFEIRLCIAGE